MEEWGIVVVGLNWWRLWGGWFRVVSGVPGFRCQLRAEMVGIFRRRLCNMGFDLVRLRLGGRSTRFEYGRDTCEISLQG